RAIADGRAVACAVGPVPVAVAVGVVGGVVVAAADHAQMVERAHDAVHVAADLPGLGVDLVGEVADVAPQDAAFQVVGLGAGDQAEVHPLGHAVVVQDACGLVMAIRVGPAATVAQGLVVRTDLYADEVLV